MELIKVFFKNMGLLKSLPKKESFLKNCIPLKCLNPYKFAKRSPPKISGGTSNDPYFLRILKKGTKKIFSQQKTFLNSRDNSYFNENLPVDPSNPSKPEPRGSLKSIGDGDGS